MSACRHEVLSLLPAPSAKLRCRQCHLTITEQELGDGCCPECLATFNIRRRDFEPLGSTDNGTTRYRCDTCGMIVTV